MLASKDAIWSMSASLFSNLIIEFISCNTKEFKNFVKKLILDKIDIRSAKFLVKIRDDKKNL